MYYTSYKDQQISDVLKEPLDTIKIRIHYSRKVLLSQIKR